LRNADAWVRIVLVVVVVLVLGSAPDDPADSMRSSGAAC